MLRCAPLGIVAAIRTVSDADQQAALFAARIARRLEARDTEGNDSAPNKHVTTTKIHCADCFPVRDEALRAHATQVAPESWFFAMSPQDQAAAWPWEDYVLAASRVPESLPEHDLAAGIGLDAAPAGERR